MNCRDSENLILAERDGELTSDQRAALSAHLGACPACRQFQQELNAALDLLKADAAAVSVPDVDEAWRDVQARIHAPRATKPVRLAPIVWLSAPLAAVAALALVFLVNRPAAPTSAAQVASTAPVPTATIASAPYDPSVIAGADFVETDNPNASTLVYVDKDSGWLVVWIADNGAATRG